MLPEPSEECFAFASFRLYPHQRTLLRGSELVAIGGRAFDVLLMLVSRAGIVVSLKELMDFVWPSVTVEEANLRVQMGMLRKILSQCDEAHRAIETIPLRGYCFILPVRHNLTGISPSGAPQPAVAPLPVLLNPVIGRDEVIASVTESLEERRMVTITGPGGIGKTTVAVAIAHSHARSYRGLMGFVDLSPANDGEQAAFAIVEALGMEAEGNPLGTLCEELRNREALLVLDTCEHIVEAMAALVETLLAQCPHLKLLLTSREALRAAGEWSHRLCSLSFPEEGQPLTHENMEQFSAVVLFNERVQAQSHFALGGRDLPMIAEICRKLDGIPLALEFAAARVSDLGLREIAGRLGDCFSILTRGRRTALPRHRTLSAALDWSYSLLSAAEQKTLGQLAQLSGPFTAEDAVALCEQAGFTRSPETLSSLYEKSLLSVDFRSDAPFYRMLDTTKAYVMNAGPG